MQNKSEQALYRWGGIAALVAAGVFLFTLLYVFGFLFSLGLTEEMLDNPATLLPWVAIHVGAYTGLYWIFLLSVVALLPVPLALYEWLKSYHPTLVRIAGAAGMIGVALGVLGPLVNAGVTPILAQAYVNSTEPADPATLRVLSLIVGEMGLLLRLSSDLFLGIWLGLNGLVIIKNATLFSRWLGWYGVGLALFILVVFVGKPLNVLDLEPALGLLLAIAYGWLGFGLLRASRQDRLAKPEVSAPGVDRLTRR
ncbi:MAG: DUF4386 family protein [Chloroflexi bacterium]|nr:DUF4386 family protein [Chloroflexota bacterium]